MQHLILMTGMLGVLIIGPARADLFGFVDENGRAHVSTVQLDVRYKLFKRTPPQLAASPPTLSAAKLPKVTAVSATRRAVYRKHVAKAAKKYNLDPALLHAVISAESHYNPAAVSRRGASGLMQLMPYTATRYRVINVFDPAQNIGGGAQYLRDLLRLFKNDMALAIAAYNAGENTVIKYGWRIPPYPETVAYVPKVLAYYAKYREKI